MKSSPPLILFFIFAITLSSEDTEWCYSVRVTFPDSEKSHSLIPILPQFHNTSHGFPNDLRITAAGREVGSGEWIEEENFLCAALRPVPCKISCYLFQQSAEKALKSPLIAQNVLCSEYMT